MVRKAEVVVDRRDEVRHAHDFIGELLRRHEEMRIVLVEAAHAEQAVQRTFELMAMNEADFARTNGKIAVAARLGGVHENAARAVHGLDAVLFVIDRGGVHIVFVVIPVAGSLPEMAVHDLGRGDFDITRLAMDLAPVIKQGVLENHAVGQEEREAGGFVAHHEKVHFATDSCDDRAFSPLRLIVR